MLLRVGNLKGDDCKNGFLIYILFRGYWFFLDVVFMIDVIIFIDDKIVIL